MMILKYTLLLLLLLDPLFAGSSKSKNKNRAKRGNDNEVQRKEEIGEEDGGKPNPDEQEDRGEEDDAKPNPDEKDVSVPKLRINAAMLMKKYHTELKEERVKESHGIQDE